MAKSWKRRVVSPIWALRLHVKNWLGRNMLESELRKQRQPWNPCARPGSLPAHTLIQLYKAVVRPSLENGLPLLAEHAGTIQALDRSQRCILNSFLTLPTLERLHKAKISYGFTRLLLLWFVKSWRPFTLRFCRKCGSPISCQWHVIECTSLVQTCLKIPFCRRYYLWNRFGSSPRHQIG